MIRLARVAIAAVVAGVRWLERWPLPRSLGCLTGPPPADLEAAWATRRVVGVCGTCGGEVVYSPRARRASCAAGCSVIPRAFLELGARRGP